jgi:hypothetical protein
MGKRMFDLWSTGHFFLGYLSKIVIFPNDDFKGFIVSNIIHALMELSEKMETPEGVVLETIKNKFGDSLVFIVGWFFAYITPFKKMNKYVYLLFVFLFLVSYLEQFLRELFPRMDLYFTKGAYL